MTNPRPIEYLTVGDVATELNVSVNQVRTRSWYDATVRVQH